MKFGNILIVCVKFGKILIKCLECACQELNARVNSKHCVARTKLLTNFSPRENLEQSLPSIVSKMGVTL